MTQASYPQQGINTGDAVHAPYSADEFSLNFMGNLLGFARRSDYGVIQGYDNGVNFGLEVTQTTVASSNVEVKPGAAVVRGMIYENTATEPLSISPNASGNPRIDTVVLRRDYSLQTIRLAVIQGTPAVTPTPPALAQTDGFFWDIPLANITALNGFSVITSTDIQPISEPIAPSSLFLDNVLNNSGVRLETGDVVIWDLTANRAVTTTTVFNHYRVAGVWVGSTAPGARGRLQRGGVGYVRVNASAGAISRNCPIVTFSTAQYGTSPFLSAPDRRSWYEVARTVENVTSGFTGLVLCDIGIRAPQGEERITLAHVVAPGTNGGTFTSGSFQQRPLTSKQIDTAQICTLASNQFTIPEGMYRVVASAPAFEVNAHRLGIGIVSGGGVVTGGGTSEYAPTGIQSRSFFSGQLTVTTSTTTFALQHICQTTKATDGMGRATNLGGEVYGVVDLIRMNDRDN